MNYDLELGGSANFIDTQLQAEEFLKCKMNPFHFIYNYVKIPEIGGSTRLTPQMLNPKMKRIIKLIVRYHTAILMASRQLGKSTIAACLIAWSLIFFQESYAVILNFQQNSALKNLATIKFIISHLPKWMIGSNPFKSKSDLKTKVELFNNSKADAYYPATSHTSTTIARSLTSAILYIDEAAFIKDMKEIWGAAQPILFKAREQAASRGFPYFQFITSTPNGSIGHGEWFQDRWMNAVDSDLLFEKDKTTGIENWTTKYDPDQIITDPNKNGFAKVQYHWREDPSKTQEWYEIQKRELANPRLVNQELDLKFVGSGNCIFPDDVLGKLKPKPVVDRKPFIHSTVLDLYIDEYPLNNQDYYIIGVDTAYSLEGAFNAVQIFRFSDFMQIAELQIKLSSYTHWGQIIHEVFQWLYKQVGERIILTIENNTIGRAPIEFLLNHVNFPYNGFMFRENNKDPFDDKYGIMTTGLSKPKMLGTLIEMVSEYPENIGSATLIGQFGALHRTSGGNIKSTTYSDLAMSASFCAYTRKYRALDILPKINFSEIDINRKEFSKFKSVIDLMDMHPKNKDMDGNSFGDPYDVSNYTEDDDFSKSGFFSFFD